MGSESASMGNNEPRSSSTIVARKLSLAKTPTTTFVHSNCNPQAGLMTSESAGARLWCHDPRTRSRTRAAMLSGLQSTPQLAFLEFAHVDDGALQPTASAACAKAEANLSETVLCAVVANRARTDTVPIQVGARDNEGFAVIYGSPAEASSSKDVNDDICAVLLDDMHHAQCLRLREAAVILYKKK